MFKFNETETDELDTVSRVQKSLIVRKIQNVRSDMNKIKRAKKVVDFCAKRIAKSGKVIRIVNTPTYNAKIARLLTLVAEQGVTDLVINRDNFGGFFRLVGKFGKLEVNGHFWADSRGPVLDIYQGDYRDLSTALIMRLKYFRNVLVYNRSLDKVMGDTTRFKQASRTFTPFVEEARKPLRHKAVPASSQVYRVQP